MDRLYGRFLKPGQLAFDIGAHVGDRISSFRRLGVHAVALEPQPLAVRALRLIHGRDPNVTLLPAACAKEMGRLRLRINSRNPTVSTGSEAFVAAAAGAGGWEGQTWDTEMDVPAVTLDLLVAAHGAPDFVKIDVEGAEADVLAGAQRTLARDRPALVVEVISRSLETCGSSRAALVQMLRGARYRLYAIDQHDASLRSIQSLSDVDEQNVVGLPQERTGTPTVPGGA